MLSRFLLVAIGLLNAAPARAQHADEPLPPGAIARLGTTRLVHIGVPTALAVSPDGAIVASGVGSRRRSRDTDPDEPGSLRFWDTKSGKLIREIKTPDVPTGSLVFDADGKTLFAGCGVYVCSIDVSKGVLNWAESDPDISRDAVGLPVVTQIIATKDKLITIHVRTPPSKNKPASLHLFRFWERDTGKSLPTPKFLASSNGFQGAAVSPDGRFALTSVVDPKSKKTPKDKKTDLSYRLRVVDIPPTKIVFEAGIEKTPAIKVAQQGTTLAIGAGTEVFLVDTTKTKWNKKTVAKDLAGPVREIAFLPEQRLAALLRNSVEAWDLATGKPVNQSELSGEFVYANLIPAKGSGIAAHRANDAILLVDTATGRQINPTIGHRWAPLIQFSSHTKDALLSCDYRNAFHWNARTGKLDKTLPSGQDLAVPIKEYSFEGGAYIRRTMRGLEVRDALHGSLVSRLELDMGGQKEKNFFARFSPAGNRILVYDKRTIQFFETATGKRISSHPFIEPKHGLYFDGALSPNGKYFAASYPGRIEIVDVASGKKIRDLVPKFIDKNAEQLGGLVYGCRFSDDEEVIIAEQDEYSREDNGNRIIKSGVALWDIASGNLIREIVRDPASHVAPTCGKLLVSPDRRLVAVASQWFSKVEIWEIASGLKRGDFAGHLGQVSDIAFSPDGKLLASGSADTTILIWDMMRPMQPVKLKDRLTKAELADDLKTLFQPDAVMADAAIWRLIHAAKDSVPFLVKHLQPVTAPDPQVIAKLLVDLDSSDFRIRSKAQADLQAFGELALSDIEAALKKDNPLERKRRLEDALQKAQKAAEPFGSNERIGQWRILEVLEKIGTPEAIAHLRNLAGGGPGAQLTIAAQAITHRLK